MYDFLYTNQLNLTQLSGFRCQYHTTIFKLLLLEGQMSDAWGTSKKLSQKSGSIGWKITFIHLT